MWGEKRGLELQHQASSDHAVGQVHTWCNNANPTHMPFCEKIGMIDTKFHIKCPRGSWLNDIEQELYADREVESQSPPNRSVGLSTISVSRERAVTICHPPDVVIQATADVGDQWETIFLQYLCLYKFQ